MRTAANKTKRIEKITNGCIYLPPLSSVLDDINKAKIFNMIKTNSEDKNNNKLNLLEIICAFNHLKSNPGKSC